VGGGWRVGAVEAVAGRGSKERERERERERGAVGVVGVQ
jgi:hypothetical protein